MWWPEQHGLLSDTGEHNNYNNNNNHYNNNHYYNDYFVTRYQVYNATEEIQKAANYPNLRLFTVDRVLSTTPLEEPPKILQKWSVASPGTNNYY